MTERGARISDSPSGRRAAGAPPSGARRRSPSWSASWPRGADAGAARRPGAVRRRRRVPGQPTTSRWCRPPTSSRRWSTTPPTSAPSPPPTPAATCSPWAAGWCWRSTSPPSPSACPPRRSRRSSPPRPRWWPRPGGMVAGGHTIRIRGADLRAGRAGPRAPRPGVHQGGRPAGRRAGAVEADRHGHRAGRWRRRRQGGGHRRHAPARTGPRPRRCRRCGDARARGHRRHRLRPAGHGWEMAERSACALRVDTDGAAARTRARWRPPRRGVRTGGDARNRDYLDGQVDVDGASPRARGAVLTTRRRRAACWPRSIRRSSATCRPGFGVVGDGRGRRTRRACLRVTVAGTPADRAAGCASTKRSPSLRVERELWDAGHEVVVGIDEVGRGAWAGPLMVGAAVLPQRQAGLQGPRLEDAHRAPSARRCSTASRRGAGRGRSATRRRRSATRSACRRRSGWPRRRAHRRARRRRPTRRCSTASGTSCGAARRSGSSRATMAAAQLAGAGRHRADLPGAGEGQRRSDRS